MMLVVVTRPLWVSAARQRVKSQLVLELFDTDIAAELMRLLGTLPSDGNLR